MSDFSKEEPLEPVAVINAVDAEIIEGNQLILTDENGKKITLTLSEEALSQLPEVLPHTAPAETAGGSRRRKSRKHKVVKRRNKSHRRHRR
jgi:hypothetical protein